MFGVWRSCQHYATPGSLPDATSESREKVVTFSTTIKPYGIRRRQFIGVLINNDWHAVGWAEEGTFSAIMPGPSRTYEGVRLHGRPWTNKPYGELTDNDHPLRTIDLDNEAGTWSNGHSYPETAPTSPEHEDNAASTPTAHKVARPVDRTLSSLDEALAIMRGLVGVELPVVLKRRNIILGIANDTADVATGRTAGSESVPVDDVQRGLELLHRIGRAQVDTDVLGDNCAFVGAVLATLPGAYVALNPTRILLAATIGDAVAEARDFSVLDGATQVKVRKEQGLLRRLLLNNQQAGDCSLCGSTYPADFLVAAHIKRRSVCSDDERRDLSNVAMLACVFGCDALYEIGYLSVSDDGTILVAEDDGHLGAVAAHLANFAGKFCAAFGEGSASYFAWHRGTIFRRPSLARDGLT